MKRVIIYVLLRLPDGVILDSYKSYEEADNRKGEFEQVFKDRGITEYSFEVQSSMYYDY